MSEPTISKKAAETVMAVIAQKSGDPTQRLGRVLDLCDRSLNPKTRAFEEIEVETAEEPSDNASSEGAVAE